MDYNLENKTIIVTGANSGIGKAAAIQLAALGATVIMACRTLERGEKALEEVKALSKSEKVVLMKVDMSSQTSIKNGYRCYIWLWQAIAAAWGRSFFHPSRFGRQPCYLMPA